MPTRYEYDLDANHEWRWIAIAANGATVGVSPVGYANLQDCMHAVGLMHAPGNFAVLPSTPVEPLPPPEKSLSRLQRR
ncbi:MAG TPA: hypothetical protein VFZ16_20265 [Hyphomicrobiaceae bacterium]|nr:hypothetical protein [Hyphomicrobiaceae bacterium]